MHLKAGSAVTDLHCQHLSGRNIRTSQIASATQQSEASLGCKKLFVRTARQKQDKRNIRLHNPLPKPKWLFLAFPSLGELLGEHSRPSATLLQFLLLCGTPARDGVGLINCMFCLFNDNSQMSTSLLRWHRIRTAHGGRTCLRHLIWEALTVCCWRHPEVSPHNVSES